MTLKFRIGTDVDDALLRVSNKLNEVPSYPENVDRPVITATGAATSPVIWMVLRNTADNHESPYTYLTYFDNNIRQFLERTEGVADLFIGGGIKKEMQIIVKPEPDANILELTDRLESVVSWLNAEKLAEEKIYLDWVYDQRPYIRGAINLVRQNILIGGTLAVLSLLIFLRSFASTAVVANAIPISIIGTFIFMNLMGRSLNVVSLAGIAFAVGMLIDSAIVVSENIDRHRSMGKSAFDAAYDGAREVWGALEICLQGLSCGWLKWSLKIG